MSQQFPQLDIFLHIPKTAGTTFKWALGHLYPDGQAYHTDDHAIKNTFKEIAMFDSERLARLHLYSGHFPFGVHRHLPKPARYFTILRHPVERVVSYYYYLCRVETSHHYKLIKENGYDLKSYIESGAATQMDNGMVRQLYGYRTHWYEDDLPFGECCEKHLEAVKTNIRGYFQAVGFLEEFNNSLIFLMESLGWYYPPFYETRNVTEKRPGIKDLPADVIRTVEKYNALDIELYDFAKKRMNDYIEQRGTAFDEKVSRFVQANEFFGARPQAWEEAHNMFLGRN